MTCYIASEIRMHFDSQGRIRAKHSAAGYDMWAPFVAAFGEVTILARLDREQSDESGAIVEGLGVRVHGLPYYTGLRSLPLGTVRTWRELHRLGHRGDVFVGRVPELVSLLALARGRTVGARTMAILAADPRTLTGFAPWPAGQLMAWVWTAISRISIRRADAVSYVSDRYFQRAFPARRGAPTIGRSNVLLPPDWICSHPRQRSGSTADPIRLVTVGSLEHRSKGMDFLVRVADALARRGLTVELQIVGDGRLRPALEAEAVARGLSVKFAGQVHDRAALRDLLDASDIYVSGSRSEGLPRATVEAMGRGLPVVTTNAGAASELVDAPFITAIDDADSFCTAVSILVTEPDAYSRSSSRSLAVARRVASLARPERFTQFMVENLRDPARG